MEQDNKINNILLEILKDLNQLINYYKDNFSIKIVGNVINKINCFFNENKKIYKHKGMICHLYLIN